MKKLFLLTVIAISFSISSYAQDIKFGFKGGVNFAKISSGDNLDKIDGRTGYHIGAVLQFSLLETLALQPELLYSAQGVKNIDIDYLNLPVLFKFKFAKVLSLEAGPQFGIVVNDNIDKEKVESATLKDLKDFDLGGAVGAGVEVGKVFGQIRYNFGLTDIGENIEGKNSVFQVSVGYYIF